MQNREVKQRRMFSLWVVSHSWSSLGQPLLFLQARWAPFQPISPRGVHSLSRLTQQEDSTRLSLRSLMDSELIQTGPQSLLQHESRILLFLDLKLPGCQWTSAAKRYLFWMRGWVSVKEKKINSNHQEEMGERWKNEDKPWLKTQTLCF